MQMRLDLDIPANLCNFSLKMKQIIWIEINPAIENPK